MELGRLPFQVSHDRVRLVPDRLSGRPIDVDRRRVVRVHREERRVPELGVDHAAQVGVDLADAIDRRVGARRIDAVATRIGGIRSSEVVALVDGEHEERVALVDPVGREPIEELAEGSVIVMQLLDVTRLTGPVREVDVSRCAMSVVGIGDVGVGDRHPGLLHLGDVGEGDGRLHAIEAREANVSGGVLDDVAGQVGHGAARLDDRVDVLGPEQAGVAGIAKRLVRQGVGARMRGCAADR